ncbi:MAG: hypothetical protein ACSLEM_00395 [Candidatus Malihini olakiniferum]
MKNDSELNRIQTKARQAEMQRSLEEAQKMASCNWKQLQSYSAAVWCGIDNDDIDLMVADHIVATMFMIEKIFQAMISVIMQLIKRAITHCINNNHA